MMDFEVRRVPPHWEHPVNRVGQYLPLGDGTNFQRDYDEWQEGQTQWERGLRRQFISPEKIAFEWVRISKALADATHADAYGACPDPGDYTPAFTREEATHFQLYKDDRPFSKACATKEELADAMLDLSDFGGQGWMIDQCRILVEEQQTSFVPRMSEEERSKHILFHDAGLSLTEIRKAIRRDGAIRAVLAAELDALKP